MTRTDKESYGSLQPFKQAHGRTKKVLAIYLCIQNVCIYAYIHMCKNIFTYIYINLCMYVHIYLYMSWYT